jgi:hypothetical protein
MALFACRHAFMCVCVYRYISTWTLCVLDTHIHVYIHGVYCIYTYIYTYAHISIPIPPTQQQLAFELLQNSRYFPANRLT